MLRALLAALALFASGCALNGEIARDAAFDASDAGAIFIVGVRLVSPHHEDYGVGFLQYDAEADRTALVGVPGAFAGFQHAAPLDGSRIDDVAYFVRRFPAGHYFLSGTMAATWRQGFLSLAIALESRTAMRVHCSINGLTNIDFDGTAISSLSVPRFELARGRIYYVGEFELDGGGNLHALPANPGRAAKALAGFPKVRGAIEPVDFLTAYSLDLPNVVHARCG